MNESRFREAEISCHFLLVFFLKKKKEKRKKKKEKDKISLSLSLSLFPYGGFHFSMHGTSFCHKMLLLLLVLLFVSTQMIVAAG
jgi:hypothetical protein